MKRRIKEAETKLDKLVNAFLDGSIEKEIYLAKKDELIQTKTDLNKRRSDFGRKGNNWIEPLKEWILTAHHAEKLASSNDFYEIKSLARILNLARTLTTKYQQESRERKSALRIRFVIYEFSARR